LNRLLINASGSSSEVENAFQLELHQYETPDGRQAYAPLSEPLVNDTLAPVLGGVIGLNNLVQWKTHVRTMSAKGSTKANTIGSGPLGGLTPSDIRAASGLSSVTQTGAGQTLALFELDGYVASNPASYASRYGISNPPALQNVLIDGYSGAAGSGEIEVELDIELMFAVAPGASRILVYEGPNSDTGLLDTYQKIANDNLAKSISSSWGLPEDQATAALLNAENTIFMQMAAQGQSLFAAAGDSGAYDDGKTLSVDDPASQPYVTGVGGTSLRVTAPGGTYVSETSWNTKPNPPEGGGGGISGFWAQPSYQAGLATTANLGSSSSRMVPDVAFNADPNTGYSVVSGGTLQVVGGTSAAAPIWAAYSALVNQQRALAGSAPLGFANPTIYRLAESTSYGSLFHDVNDGSTNLHYPAVTGYDLSTGWGSFNAPALLTALVNPALPPAPPGSLTVTPHHTLVSLSWAASAGATSYAVFRATSASGPFTQVGSAMTTTSYVDTGLVDGTTYYYEVSAINAAGSAQTAAVSATPLLVVPEAPRSFTVTGVSN
jgi:kumamolisin